MKAVVALLALSLAACSYLEERHAQEHPLGAYRLPIGAVAGVIAGSIAANTGNDAVARCAAGFGASALAGTFFQPVDGWRFAIGIAATKEVRDAEQGGQADLSDFAATTFCGAVPYLAMEKARGAHELKTPR